MKDINTMVTPTQTSVIFKDYSRFTLVGREYIKIEDIHVEITKLTDADTNKQISKNETETIKSVLEFPLQETNRAALYELRKTNQPIFILKDKDKLFVSIIPNDLGFMSSDLLGVHQCAAGFSCVQLSAASDEDGGCEKVRNKARYIELYPWILLGYETYHTKQDTFMVAECEHYQNDANRKKPANVRELRRGLADFMYDGNSDFVGKYGKKE